MWSKNVLDNIIRTERIPSMKIAVIQASSQSGRNALIYETVKRFAADSEVINFGCTETEDNDYSYIEISILIGMLINSGSFDLVVTGCSSGQGMMLACNSMPDVICGYAPTPKDAYLFAQINDGNAISLPLGEGYAWAGEDNLTDTIKALFSEPFGQGYPKPEAERKLKDTALLKRIRHLSQTDMTGLLDRLDQDLIGHVLTRKDVVDHILDHSQNEGLTRWIRKHL